MGFEESMMEDGFHDEQEYLDHLMNEADKEFESQQEMKSSWNSYSGEEEDYEEETDYYYRMRNEMSKWVKENPLKWKFFIVWVHLDTEWNYQNKNFLLDKFDEWISDEEEQMERIEDYYGSFYPRLLKYFTWQIENPIEEIIRQPSLEYYSGFSEDDMLEERVEDYERYIKDKDKYAEWILSVSPDEKKEYVSDVYDIEFDGDISMSHIRECVITQMKRDDISKKNIQKVLDWYDSNGDKAREFCCYIKCVKHFDY